MELALVVLLLAASPFVVSAKPSFSTLNNVYPTYSAYPSATNLKTAMGLPDWLFKGGHLNTCAIRMSKAFIDAGLTLNHNNAAYCSASSYAEVHGSTGSYNNKEIFIRAQFFKCYLQGIWGSPDRTSVSSTSEISGKKGLLVFTGCSGFGQHIDLWNGYSCTMACSSSYFSGCSTVVMYNLS